LLRTSLVLALALSLPSVGRSRPLAGAPAAEAERRPDLPAERARWNALLRADRDGRVLSENRLKALRQACELPLDASMAPAPAGSFVRSDIGPSVSTCPRPEPEAGRAAYAFGGAAWQSIGPRGTNTDYSLASGRVATLTLHPRNPSIVLLGSATGGIWKSTDAGSTWRPVSDTAPALAVSAIAYAPSNASIVYAATGEVDSADLELKPSRSFGTYLGAGVLKSVDGGESWTRVDVDLPPNAVLSRVVVHPKDPNLVAVGVYVVQDLAADRCGAGGVYRSTDGGVHFERTLVHHVSDLAQDPKDPSTLWGAFAVLSTGLPDRDCADPELPSGVYRSTDFGRSWEGSLVPATPGATFESPTGNIKLAVSTASAESPATRVTASVLDRNDEHTEGGIFRTTDGGATWVKRSVDTTMCPDPDSPQCSYNHFIVASPDDPDTLYFGAINIWKSTDGAATWRKLTDIYRGQGTLHPDQHAAVVPPGSPNTLLVANDGGVYRSRDGGVSYESLNQTLTLTQFNSAALHPTDPSVVFGGSQDNGNQRFRNALVWSDRTGSDGGANLVKSDEPQRVLAINFYALMQHSRNGGDSYDDVTSSLLMSGFGPRETMAFYPPLVAAPGSPGMVYLGTQRLWVNTAFGSDRNAWTARSPHLTDGVLYSLEVVGTGAAIWAGSSRGEVFLSTSSGASFENRSAGLPGPIVTSIKAFSADGRSAYVALGGFTGLPSRHVFRTTDGGATWTNVSGNLPDVPVMALALPGSDPTELFAGTDVGVFRTTDGGASWSSFNQGLPNAGVYDLQVHPQTGDLVAATYGRGMFRISPTGTVRPLLPSAGFSFSPAVPRAGESVAFTNLSAGDPTGFAWDFGDGATSTERNPRHAYAQAGGYRVTLIATNDAGSQQFQNTVLVSDGFNAPVTLQVPVVLDVFGVPPTHFTSDLTLVNRSPARVRAQLVFTTAPELPGQEAFPLQESLAPGQELLIPDVIAYLAERGYTFGGSGLRVGTLRVTFTGVTDPSLVFAGSRTSTPNPDPARGGSFGLFFNAQADTAAVGAGASVFGLREDEGFRTNLALVDVPGGSGPARVSVQLYDGETGETVGAPTIVALRPGEWLQLPAAVRNGWARVTRVGGGTNRFLAYGSLTDGPRSGGGTGDGSILGTDAAAGLLPIVLQVTSGSVVFATELVLANPTSAEATVRLHYTPSPQLGGGAAGTATLTLPPGRQLRRADAIAFLRGELKLPLAADGNQGGTLEVTGAVAYARTFNGNPNRVVGGTLGLAYPAVPSPARARNEAWVYGLAQDETTRSNLAIADARVGNPSLVTYLIEVYDAVSGDPLPKATLTRSLAGGEWHQLSSFLYEAGVVHGYVRVKPQSGSSDYVVYGILNDGATPDRGTSDGSYVSMSGVK